MKTDTVSSRKEKTAVLSLGGADPMAKVVFLGEQPLRKKSTVPVPVFPVNSQWAMDAGIIDGNGFLV